MKKLSILLSATFVFVGLASAAITPAIVPGSPTAGSGVYAGDFVWNYMISVDNLEQLVSGSYATCADGTSCGTFYTIYDFQGYVAGSVVAPTAWTASAQLTGVTPGTQIPADNPGVTNLTFTYTGPPDVNPGPIVDLAGFSAVSLYGTASPQGVFTYQAQKISGGLADSGTGHIDVPTVPLGVPEPTSMALIGGGLIGLAVLRRKYAR